jgi:outer membrane protein OmpA-like peptidoglycan-associated protein
MKIRPWILLPLALSLGGCASYSSMVNSFAPPKQQSQVQLTSYQPSGEKSPFCEVPPQPVPPAKVTEVYMVMPEKGKEGTVDVIFNDGQGVTLHGDYSSMSLAGQDKKAFTGNEKQMRELFGAAVDALPPAPMSATLYFLLGKDELTPESKAEAEKIYQTFVERQSPEIWVIGHTDTVGPAGRNQALSLKRAEKVRQSLIKLGVPADSIRVEGRGEHDLLVKTPDNTKEPRNRRAEINVR